MSKILVLGEGGMKTLLLAVAAQKEGEVVICYLDFAKATRKQELYACKQIALYTDADLQVLEAPQGIWLNSHPASLVTFFCWLLEHARRLECAILYHGLCKEDYVDSRGNTYFANEAAVERFYTTVSTLYSLLQSTYTQTGTFIGHSSIELPLYRLTRRQILTLGTDWYLPWDLTWSCSQAGVFPCGTCRKCQLRKNAFLYENLSDPIIYQRRLKPNEDSRKYTD